MAGIGHEAETSANDPTGQKGRAAPIITGGDDSGHQGDNVTITGENMEWVTKVFFQVKPSPPEHTVAIDPQTRSVKATVPTTMKNGVGEVWVDGNFGPSNHQPFIVN